MPFYDAIRIGSSAVSDTAFTVDRSLRFNAADSAYLNRTTASGNRRSFSISVWIKRAKFASQQIFVSTGDDGSNQGGLQFLSDDTLNFFSTISNTYYQLTTTQVFRDPSAWYHIVAVFDTENSTSGDRIRLYVNGARITAFGTETQPSQNYDSFWNQSGKGISLGIYEPNNSSLPLGGYMAEINFIDGQAYDPSYFGETNSITGQWIPKQYTGSYGTNGFYLNFSDNSGTSATTLGKDSSGNSNNFTPNNFVTGDAVKDSPTNNFATLDVLAESGGTYSEGNLKVVGTSDPSSSNIGFASGKFYYEAYIDATSNIYVGVIPIDFGLNPARGGNWTHGAIAYRSSGQQYKLKAGGGYSSVSASYGASYTAGDIIGCAVDIDNDTVTFYKNGVSQGNTSDGVSYITASGTTSIYGALVYCNGGNNTFRVNFGQDSTFQGTVSAGGNTDANGIGDFKYTVPTGYKALCSANLPNPTILLPDKHFDTFTYSGDGNSTQTLSNVLEFQPDWVWLKGSNTNYSHTLYDSRRGAGSLKALNSNETRPEGSTVQDDSTFGFLSSFDANGITVTKGSDSTSYTNGSSSEYVAWNWLAGGADSKTYKVKVVADSTDYGHGTGSNKYQFFKSDGTTGFGTNAVDLDLEEGGTYVFDWSDSSAQLHPLRFSLTNDGTHSNGTSAGTEYTTGVTKDDSAYKTTITIASGVANLFYYCQNHSGMGAEINTNTTKGSTNFDGSILSVVKANTTAGFSLTSFTVSSSAAYTVGHGLGVAPKVIIMKSRTQTFNWDVFHASVGNTKRIRLNDNTAPEDYTGPWNDTDPTSTVFSSVGSWLNNSSDQIAYIFSEVAGYSKFGSYTGNGSSDGIFVFTGFRPAFVLQRRTDSSGHWYIFDNKRAGFNVDNKSLSPDLSASQYTVTVIDLLSNGFKLRSNAVAHNASSGTYLYIAFAESPYKNARAR